MNAYISKILLESVINCALAVNKRVLRLLNVGKVRYNAL